MSYEQLIGMQNVEQHSILDGKETIELLQKISKRNM